MRFDSGDRSLATILTDSGIRSELGEVFGIVHNTKQALYFRFQFSLII